MITTRASTSSAVTERESVNRRLAYEAAVEGIVLLENDGTLPLAPCSTALFGSGAEFTIRGGTGSGEVYVRHEVTVLEGLEQAGFTITSHDWLRRYADAWHAGKKAFIQASRKKLLHFSAGALADLIAEEYRYPSGDPLTDRDTEGADTCIYVLSRQSGEGYDRKDEPGSFRLNDVEIGHIRFCARNFRRFVLVINAGAPVDLSPLDGLSGIGAVVYMGQLGMEGGRALADVLSGAQTPSGALAVSWPRSYASVPFGDEFGLPGQMHAMYREGIYVGYRYYDTFHVEPRYPFGFGRSYTEFALSQAKYALDGTEITCTLSVRNTGSMPGMECVQLYASCPQQGMKKEYQRLTAFAKTGLLKPSESASLQLSFPVSALSSYDENASETCLEPGDYILRLGTDSRTTVPSAILRVPVRTVIARHRPLCRPEKPVCTLTPDIQTLPVPDSLPVLTLAPEHVKTCVHTYALLEEKLSAQVMQHLDRLRDRDRLRFCAGTGLFGEKTGFCVPGAVGHTPTAWIDQGIPNIELCDGPAGLRIQRRSTRTRSGKIKAVDTALSIYEILPGFMRRFLLGNPEKEQVLYQYVTGFPAAAMIAQTWNPGLARNIGRAVSAEMTEFGVKVWLAPALNIVRNPLCGRNYEYYSEDPLLSGAMAAAVTMGVQETPGNYVTIKHFAANNQEENRYSVSSDVDERALREIYLRGFEMVVRTACPRTVMTAYNKINGVYCANHAELCNGILRGEWGFDGVIMTDWLSTGKKRADEGTAIKAGVDLIMPGGRGTIRALERALDQKTLPSEDVRRACARVLSLILD